MRFPHLTVKAVFSGILMFRSISSGELWGVSDSDRQTEKLYPIEKKRILVNPGSIGQPRDRDPRAAWCILDTRKEEIRFMRSEYNIKTTQEEMKKIGSSDFLIERLGKGI